MREPQSNVFTTCAEHAVKPRPEFHGFPAEQYVGLYVKRAFDVLDDAQVTKEHMWVLVTRSEGETLVGVLSNDPACDVGIKCGDEVRFAITDIEAVMTR